MVPLLVEYLDVVVVGQVELAVVLDLIAHEDVIILRTFLHLLDGVGLILQV